MKTKKKTEASTPPQVDVANKKTGAVDLCISPKNGGIEHEKHYISAAPNNPGLKC